MFETQKSERDKFWRDWSQHQNTCKSQSGTGPGVRSSKHPLLVCRTRCQCSIETSRNKVKSQIRYSYPDQKQGQNCCNVLSMQDVTVYGHPQQCRVPFGRGEPHIV